MLIRPRNFNYNSWPDIPLKLFFPSNRVGKHVVLCEIIQIAVEYLHGIFSFDCRKVIWFFVTALHDWLKNLAPLFRPIRSKAKPNHDSFACSFLPFTSFACNYFELWLVHITVCALCDWLERLLSCYDTIENRSIPLITRTSSYACRAHCTSKVQALCLSNMILKAEKLNTLPSKCLVSTPWRMIKRKIV